MKPFAAFPDIGPRGGYSEFLRVYWFGARMASIVNAPGADDLIARVIAGDVDGDEEATAIHLLRSRHPEADLEIEPGVKVGARERKPDFRVRGDAGPWVYVEVTRLHQSAASARVHALLARLVDQVMAVSRPFVLELLLNREPAEAEEETLVIEARRACEAADGHRIDIGDVGSVLVKSGNAAVIVPSLTPNDARPRMAISKAVVGPGQPSMRSRLSSLPARE